MTQKNRSHLVTRRRFLASTSAAIGAPCLLPGRVLGTADSLGAGRRLTVAHIGMGGAHLDMSLKFRELGMVNIAAV